MPVSSNRRQRAINFTTPKVADLVIVEVVDSSKTVNSADAADATAYGTAHPNTSKFPEFKLAFIKNADDDQGQFQYWYYVKDRANQDDYNWEFSAAGGANPRYDTVVRTYIIPRTGLGIAGVDYFDDAVPKIGWDTALTTDALTPMPVTDSDPFTVADNYILFEKKQTRSGDETLDTLYVVEQRVFIKKVPMRRVDVDDTFPQADPAENSDATIFNVLRSKETLFHKDEPIAATYVFGDPDDSDREDDIETLDETTEVAFRDSTLTFDPLGKAYGPSAFWGVDDNGIMREGRQLSDNWYAILEREVIRFDPERDNLVSEYATQQNYSWPAVLDGTTDLTQDEDLGAELSNDSAGGIVGFTWTRRDGGGDTVAVPVYKRHAYSGPTDVDIRIYWKKSPWDRHESPGSNNSADKMAYTIPMLPKPISFITPLFTLNVRPTLHTDITLTCTTGTNHPKWVLAGARFDYPATNYEDWPDHVIISDTQKPYRGGYLREAIRAANPADSFKEVQNKDYNDWEGAPGDKVLK